MNAETRDSNMLDYPPLCLILSLCVCILSQIFPITFIQTASLSEAETCLCSPTPSPTIASLPERKGASFSEFQLEKCQGMTLIVLTRVTCASPLTIVKAKEMETHTLIHTMTDWETIPLKEGGCSTKGEIEADRTMGGHHEKHDRVPSSVCHAQQSLQLPLLSYLCVCLPQ